MPYVRPLAVLALACAAVFTDSASASILPAIGGTAAAGSDTPITGVQPGATVEPAGDVNGDGKADLIVGDRPAQVLLGSASTAPVDLATAGDRLWSLPDTWTDPLGQRYSVPLTTLGDVNGDGSDDLFARPDLSGREVRPAGPDIALAVIAAGRAGAGGTSTDLGSPTAVLTRIVSSAPGRTFLSNPVAIGDHDGDGFDDVLLNWSARDVAASGLTVIYGGPNLAGTVDLHDPAERGYRVYATPPASVPPGGGDPSSYTYLRSIVGVGDVNGDRLGDFALQRMVLGGKSYAWFVYGKRSRPGDLDLDQRAGRAARVGPVELGSGIVPMGDLNADGLADVAVSTSGSSAVVLRGRTATIDMGISTTFQRINWRIEAPYDSSTVPPGDINGDRIPDVAVSAINQGTSQSMSMALFGRADGRAISVPYLGTATTAAVRFGAGGADGVATAGDVNGDGLTDLLTGGGIVYGYGQGTNPTPDVTPPTLALRVASNYYVGTCGLFAQRSIVPGAVSADLSEAVNLELVAVQNGITRRASVPAGPGQNLYVYLPKSLISPSLGLVTVTATPVDTAGNRGVARSVTLPILKSGYTFVCP